MDKCLYLTHITFLVRYQHKSRRCVVMSSTFWLVCEACLTSARCWIPKFCDVSIHSKFWSKVGWRTVYWTRKLGYQSRDYLNLILVWPEVKKMWSCLSALMCPVNFTDFERYRKLLLCFPKLTVARHVTVIALYLASLVIVREALGNIGR